MVSPNYSHRVGVPAKRYTHGMSNVDPALIPALSGRSVHGALAILKVHMADSDGKGAGGNGCVLGIPA